jgi:hypothetical protein
MSVDPSEIVNGGIYKLRHRHIRFPENLWNPQPHRFRTVIVVSSNEICQSCHCDVVSVAPLSSDLSLMHPTDYVLARSPQNGLRGDSRIALGHIQPVRKTVFERQYGRVTDGDWRAIILKIIDNFDRSNSN